MTDNPLGTGIPAPDSYDPAVLYPIARQPARSRLGLDATIPLHGFDHWRAYELSWLNRKGKPMVAVAEFVFAADSVNLVESKSLKLYLNSLNQQKFTDSGAVSTLVGKDLSSLCKSEVKVVLRTVDDQHLALEGKVQGRNIDRHDINMNQYQPDAGLLRVTAEGVVDEQVNSLLFRSNCPVTGAPDWASVQIRYTGQRIEEQALLRYLCSFRQHQAYHEECVEHIYRDLMRQCQLRHLYIGMNFLRRGGLEINVYRSSSPINAAQARARQIRQ